MLADGERQPFQIGNAGNGCNTGMRGVGNTPGECGVYGDRRAALGSERVCHPAPSFAAVGRVGG